MKQVSYLFFLCALLVSCSPTSNIITSKSEAQKKGIYREPTSEVAMKRTTSSRNLASAGKIKSRNTPGSQAVTKRNASKKIINEQNAQDVESEGDNSSYMVRQLINTASANLGAGYHTGGTNPNSGFDCSGLMFSTFQKFDITLPRSSNDMAKVGRKLDNDEIQKGDLVFFRTNGRSVINHVGMVTEVSDEEIKFIHSSTQKGVIISSTKESYYGRTFAQANRIVVN